MLARALPSGTEAISFRNTLFRVSELCWIKAVRLMPLEIGVRVLLVILAAAWILAMGKSKGSFQNVEFLLAVFPILLAWNTSGSLRIGCSGDFEESYEERKGARGDIFRSWIETLRSKEPDWVHLKGANYEFLLNPKRIAWVRPCYQWSSFPLLVGAVFWIYLYIMDLGLNVRGYPVIDDFQILIFEGQTGSLRFLCYLMIVLSLVCFVLSVKRSMEICGTGGVQDTFALSSEDQDRLIAIVMGKAPKATARPKAAISQPVETLEVAVAKADTLPEVKPSSEASQVNKPSSKEAKAEPTASIAIVKPGTKDKAST